MSTEYVIFHSVIEILNHIKTLGPLYTSSGEMIHRTNNFNWIGKNPLIASRYVGVQLYYYNPIQSAKEDLSSRKERYNEQLESVNKRISNIVKK